MHPLSCYLLRLWVYCRSSYSCWFVNCLSPTRCHLSAVPQSPSHVGRSAWRLPTSLTCSNRPHLRHTPPDPSGINSFSLHSCAAIAASQSVLCCGEGRGQRVGGLTEGMLGRNNETIRRKAGRKVHDNNGCAVQTAAARTASTHPRIINAAAEEDKKPERLVGFATALMTMHNSGGTPADKGGHLHLGLMLGQRRVEK